MYSKHETCDRIKAEYLRQVEKVLSSVKSPRVEQVIEDIKLHLDQRFAELEPGRRTAENLQAIIAEMGSPSDYAELLAPDTAPPSRKVWRKYLLGVSLAVVVLITAILLPRAISAKLGFGTITDSIDYPFVNDPPVIGAWKTVDFVKTIEDFNPGQRRCKEEFWLNHLVFEEGGEISGGLLTWTKGLVLNSRKKTVSAYETKKVDGTAYLFLKWKGGNSTIRHMQPRCYVLKKVRPDSVKAEPMFGKKADIPPTSTIHENGHIVDKIDYTSVDDPEVLGTRQSVAPREANLLLNGGAEQGKNGLPSFWFKAAVPADGLKIYSDDEQVHSGKFSFAISNTHEYAEMVGNNWAQNIMDAPTGKIVRLSAYIKAEDADSVNVCLQCWGVENNMLAFASTPVLRGDQDWVLIYSHPLVVPPETSYICVRAVLTGLGKAWFDEISVTVVDMPTKTGNDNDVLTNIVKGEIAKILPMKKDCMRFSYTSKCRHGSIDNVAVVVAGWLLVPTSLKTPAFGSEQNSILASVESQPMFGKKADLPPTSIIRENGLIADKVDYPFVNDPELLGVWESVDFVSDIDDFKPATRSFEGQLYLKELFIFENGETNWAFTWTNGLILSAPGKTASKYVVKGIYGSTYMFFEWKSGDYTIRHMKPGYYVLKKRQPDTRKPGRNI